MDKEIVQKVATIARIKLNEEEIEGLCSEMEKILEHFAAIKKLKVERAGKFALENPIREDRAELTNATPIIEQFTKKEERYLPAPKTVL